MADKIYYGIDVSMHQGIVNMTNVKKHNSSKDFVIIRAGYGKYSSQKDPTFENNYKNAVAAGLSVGAYWYSYATTVEDAREEANVFLNTIRGKKFDMPVAFDIEDATQVDLSNQTIGNIITTFANIVEKAGYYMMLYSYENFLINKVPSSVLKKYDIWCANTITKPSIKYGIHQYSFKGNVSGIIGDVDLNCTTIDYPTLIKSKGFNGYSKNSDKNETTTKELDTLGFRYKDKDEGVLALKKLLLIAMDKKIISKIVLDNTIGFGTGTVKAVNAVLKKWGYTENGIAGTKFINKLYNEIIK